MALREDLIVAKVPIHAHRHLAFPTVTLAGHWRKSAIGPIQERMNRQRTRIEIATLVLLLLLASPPDALAYIDPGTGSYLFQLLLAGGLAGLYTVRKYWFSVKATWVSAFRRGPRNPPPRQDGVH